MLPAISIAQTTKDLGSFTANKQASIKTDNQNLIQAPNTKVYLTPPAHFTANPEINGFIHKGSSSTIQVVEIANINPDAVTTSLDSSYFSIQGFYLKNTENILLNNGENGIIYTTTYTIKNEEYYRLFFFTGETNTVWINVNFPAIVKILLYDPIIESLKTVCQK